MKTRVQLKMSWTVKLMEKGLPFSSTDEFIALANRFLVTSFAHYNATLVAKVEHDYFGEMADISLVWDVDLDMVPGGYHTPKDHEAYARTYLLDGIKLFASRLKIETLRHPTQNDVDGATSLTPWDDGYYARRYDALTSLTDA